MVEIRGVRFGFLFFESLDGLMSALGRNAPAPAPGRGRHAASLGTRWARVAGLPVGDWHRSCNRRLRGLGWIAADDRRHDFTRAVARLMPTTSELFCFLANRRPIDVARVALGCAHGAALIARLLPA